MAAMLVADMGATVLRVERPRPSGLGLPRPARFTFVNRGRRSVVVDLKSRPGIELALALTSRADALIEGHRPGTMERIGLGPDTCLRVNPRLVYARMTGWGQDGPLAHAAAHDLNYVALSGALDAIGRAGAPPTVPLNLIGDYGGAAYLVIGLLAALLEARSSGRGQVVDAAMVDAATSLMTFTYGLFAAGMHGGGRGTNLLDGGAPFYDVYATRSGDYVAVGALEPQFFDALCRGLELFPTWSAAVQMDESQWPRMRADFERVFAEHSRDHWVRRFAGSDACVSPVLSLSEAVENEQLRARDVLRRAPGVVMPAPAPRTGGEAPRAGLEAVLRDLGVAAPARQVLNAARVDG